eukprot:TRINITY_DN3485_c0_g1_i1.p1 TRINITY_DN3485_c0_g1~~TRINITY_DN3485_c0_g1_i1.p1  ORF type:complete len:262 (+),score=64.78 TRINITY_DN3485_c0_g1_i1:373-1158(+)
MKEINRILEESDADIIALQEVKQHMLKDHFLTQEWLRKSYYVSDAQGTTFTTYGVVIFSKLPMVELGLHKLPSDMGRRLLLATFKVGDSILSVGTTHLESHAHNSDRRAEQMKHIYDNHIYKSDNFILIGDMNTEKHEDSMIQSFPDLIDSWMDLYPKSPGGTFGQRRYDRILVKSKQFKVISINKIGTEKIPVDIQEEIDRKQKKKEEEDADSNNNNNSNPNSLLAQIKARKKSEAPDTSDIPSDTFPSDHFGLSFQVTM